MKENVMRTVLLYFLQVTGFLNNTTGHKRIRNKITNIYGSPCYRIPGWSKPTTATCRRQTGI